MKQHTYIAIDLKSFYASVECRERGLDPLDTNLVVADESRTDKTICLAVTPSLKSYGISGRGRLFEVKQRVKEANAGRQHDAPGRRLEGSSHFFSELQADPSLAIDFIIAPPRMAYYMEYSTRIYHCLLYTSCVSASRRIYFDCIQHERGEGPVIIRSEEIYKKANSIVKSCGTRDTLKIARELGIHLHFLDNLNDLLGMYTYRHKERHILLNSNMEYLIMQMVCGHEIGHDIFHRDLAKGNEPLPEFVLFDMRTKHEYEANAFASHLIIDDDELIDLMKQDYDVVQLSAAMGTNINLMLIKLNELNRMGWQLNLPYVPHSDFLKNVRPEG